MARRVLHCALAWLLVAAGLVGALSTGTGVARAAAVQPISVAGGAVIGTFSNSQADVAVIKRVTGSGSGRLAVYVVDVRLTDATALRAAFAKGTLNRSNKEPVSDMAKANNAALAVNCDWVGWRMNGIIIRNGTTYIDQPKRPGFVINRDGSAALYDETKTTAAKMLADGAWQTVSFGPWLLHDGVIPAGTAEYETDAGTAKPGERSSMRGIHPRAGIGYLGRNHFLLVGVDGYPENGSGSRGMTVAEFASLFAELGVKEAYNFDGGGSWTLYLNGTVLNIPGDEGEKERLVGDILYIAK